MFFIRFIYRTQYYYGDFRIRDCVRSKQGANVEKVILICKYVELKTKNEKLKTQKNNFPWLLWKRL